MRIGVAVAVHVPGLLKEMMHAMGLREREGDGEQR